MTRPDGEAFIDVHANTDPYERELRQGIRKASDDADKLMDAIGTEWGEHLADSTSDELGKHGRDYAKSIEDSIQNEVIHINGKRYVIDRTGRLHDAAGRFARLFEDEVETSFRRRFLAGGAGGLTSIFNKIGQAASDAIGAGFNISGRSPLIALLVPVFGAIADLILGAVQAVNALGAALTTLPALIASIGIQVGVLVIAFQGMGKAVSGAFAAKNAKELQEALKGLTPEAQNFVKSLLPLKPIFAEIKRVVQSNFFRALGDPFAGLRALSPDIIRGLGDVATALGGFFHQLGEFFQTPTFRVFVKDIFPATIRWIQTFGPALIRILGSLIGMADQALPLLERIGRGISGSILKLSNFIDRAIRTGGFEKWLDSAAETLSLVGDLFVEVLKFVGTFMAVLDTAGGDETITALTNGFKELGAFLASPEGVTAMRGLVNVVVALTDLFFELVTVTLLVLAAFQLVGTSVKEFWTFVTTVLDPAINNFFAHTVPDVFKGAATFIRDVWNTLGDFLLQKARDWGHGIAEWFKTLPSKVKAAIGDLGHLLFDAGRALIQGLINGIKSKFADLGNAARDAMGVIGRFIPGSPAEEGPFSGQGYTLLRGQRMVEDLGKGMSKGFGQLQAGLGSDLGAMVNMLTPSSSTSTGVMFGPGAIKVTFEGALPTEEQARQTGRAVGAGINDQLAKRNTVLAVRTL